MAGLNDFIGKVWLARTGQWHLRDSRKAKECKEISSLLHAQHHSPPTEVLIPVLLLAAPELPPIWRWIKHQTNTLFRAEDKAIAVGILEDR